MQFMVDCLPAIRELLRDWPRDLPAHVLDVGTASGAGANLLGQLYASPILGPRLIVDAMELHPWMARYARAKLPFVRRYIVADVRNYWTEEPWDLVLCSHTLEHVRDWEPFVAALRRLATHWVLVYTPWQEEPRIPEHAITVDETLLARAGAERHWIIESPAWYRGPGQEARCVAFLLHGAAHI
jgi:trans-aconitate methyltransferase